jgi:hypothetical protein
LLFHGLGKISRHNVLQKQLTSMSILYFYWSVQDFVSQKECESCCFTGLSKISHSNVSERVTLVFYSLGKISHQNVSQKELTFVSSPSWCFRDRVNLYLNFFSLADERLSSYVLCSSILVVWLYRKCYIALCVIRSVNIERNFLINVYFFKILNQKYILKIWGIIYLTKYFEILIIQEPCILLIKL